MHVSLRGTDSRGGRLLNGGVDLSPTRSNVFDRVVGDRGTQHGCIDGCVQRLKHRLRPCFHRRLRWPNDRVWQPDKPSIRDDGNAAREGLKGRERLPFEA